MPLATAGVVALSIALPTLDLAKNAFALPPVGGKGTAALVATICYLPLYVRLVLHAVRGSRPAGARWTLAAIAAVIIGAVPIIGVGWLSTLHSLAVSVLILVRVPWSLAIFAGLVAAPIPLAVALGAPVYGPYYSVAVAWRSLVLFVLLWQIAAVRQLHAARLTLAEDAVTRERLRIESELHLTLGAALEAIADQAARASMLARQRPAAAEEEVRALGEGSRQTLAKARRMVRGYQQASLRSELDRATTLLAAVGIESRVVLPDDDDLADAVEASLRSTLRSAVARLLGDDATRSCVITVTRRDGRLWLELRPEQTGQMTTEMTTS
jgi:two-component system sensor histidine kinase DesK